MFNKLFLIFLICILSACSSTKNISSNTDKYHGSLSSTDKEQLMVTSKLMLNTKYTYGGKQPDFGVDCSGFVSYVFKNSINYNISGAAKHMATKGITIPTFYAFSNSLQVGDLLFFNTTGKSFSHVGIYIGKGNFIHASSGQKQVIISNITNSYYKNRLELIKRL